MSDHRNTLLIPLGTRNLECLAALVWNGGAKYATAPAGSLGMCRAPRGKA